MTQVIVCCGAGGTGKTTLAAALAARYAINGWRAVVLTIDPARRLADALGLAELDNEPHAVPLDGLGATGTLHALMLDRKATFDAIVHKYTPNSELAERLLENSIYQAVSTRLTGLHEYMAIEKLQQLVESGLWDIVVLDTPPAQHAIDFFRAPERVKKLFEKGVLQTLTQPARGLLGLAGRKTFGLIARIAGEDLLEQFREFFSLMGVLSDVIRGRNQSIHQLLRSEQARFYIITRPTLEAIPDVTDLFNWLQQEKMNLAGVIVNRVIPKPNFQNPLSRSDLPETPMGVSSEAWSTMADALIALIPHAEAQAQLHLDATTAIGVAAHAPVFMVPELPNGIRTIDTLAAVGKFLPE